MNDLAETCGDAQEMRLQRLKFSDPAHGTRELQPERDGRVSAAHLALLLWWSHNQEMKQREIRALL